jgi:hypothetical protein
MLPEMLVRGLAAEVFPADPTQVSSTHRAAEVTSAHPSKMASAHPATEVATTATVASASASACQRIGRNARAHHRHGGNDDRDLMQCKFLHGSFLSGCDHLGDSPLEPSPRSIGMMTGIYLLR